MATKKSGTYIGNSQGIHSIREQDDIYETDQDFYGNKMGDKGNSSYNIRK